ncbi:MAG: putative rane transporter protein [Bacteroidetes bacterium]|nr:putative rane transporter protein [Bacteroidota bacterium]
MDIASLLILLLAGCLAGFLAGFFGVGGGIILVPILLFYFQTIAVSSLVATHVAFGTSLLIVIFASMTSAYQYAKNGHVVWRAVIILGVASIVGAFIGSTIAAELQGKALQRIFATVVTIASFRLLIESKKPKGEQKPNLGIPGLGATGGVVGIVSSLAGVGGGVFSIPMMYTLLKFPLKKALGTSSATIVITAFAATLGYVWKGWGNPLLPPHTLGYVDYLHSIPIIVGTLPFARLGASVAHKTHVDNLRKFYAVFLLIIAVKMFFF